MQTLSAWLRTATSPAHRGLEARTGWPETLDGADRMATMLLMFRALHASLDEAWTAFDGCFHRNGFVPARGAAVAAIDDDLDALGPAASRHHAIYPSAGAFDAALGLHYVAAGSAMGNILLLRHVEARRDLAAADRFLRQSASRAVPNFREFRATLDRYGMVHPGRCAAVVAGADAAYRGCIAWLDAADPNGPNGEPV